MVNVLRPSAMPDGPRTSTLRRLDKARRGPRRHEGRRLTAPAAATDERRYCPLCDHISSAKVCPKDGVRTISASIIDAGADRLPAGTLIDGAYRIDEVIGEGAMGRVYRATQLSVNRPVAIKFLSRRNPRDKEELRRFFREAYVASKIDHPNIVHVIEFGVDERTAAPFIVMKYVAGENLHQLLRREGPLAPERAAALLSQVARALSAAHGIGLVHRDLKPANVMVTRRNDGVDHVTVIDFGVAKSVGPDEAALSQSGLVIGTPMYMSPEQAVGEVVDAKTDLYAMGCLLHEMLCGTAPPLRLGSTAAPPAFPQCRLPASNVAQARLEALHQALLAQASSGRPANAITVALELEAIVARWSWHGQPTLDRVAEPPVPRPDAESQDPVTESYALMKTVRRRRPRASSPRG